jgi:hypothetical protein
MHNARALRVARERKIPEMCCADSVKYNPLKEARAAAFSQQQKK